MSHVSADALRGHVAFLSSDLLEGRDTPSRGLNIAAEYIATQFALIGLEPAGSVGYFQKATVSRRGETYSSQNVAGLLRGSDPKLRDQYVIVSSHYDHIGVASTGDDRIFNGANDDASGVATVLETASALASLHPHPKRSVLFLLFFGEEKGLLGSQYYAAHPLKPLEQTVAQLNLEQMGRTDSSEGPKLKSANLTGWEYSTLTQTLVEAGRQAGVTIAKDPKASDAYFNRSDNAPLARLGIPAHTMSVTYEFPDYHAVGDEWQKIDYANMAQVDRAVALTVLRLASSPVTLKWNANYGRARPFFEAAQKLNATRPALSQSRP